MPDEILKKLAKKASRSNDFEEQQLAKKTRKFLSTIKSFQRRSKNRYEKRGGLYSMGAKDIFVKDGGIYSRRVIVKVKIKKNKDGNFKENLRKHLDYMTRTGAGKDGQKPELFFENDENSLIKNITEKFSESPHNFRIIISPEDSDKIDLKEFTKSLIKTIQQDLDKKLNWVASVHYDTNEPHIHLLVNGNDITGDRLLMTRDYISNGIRNRSSQIISNKIGLRDWDEVIKSLNLDVYRDRRCSLDNIIKKHITEGEINLKKLSESDLDEIPKFLFQKRLTHLESKGIARLCEKDTWQIKENYLYDLKEINRTNTVIENLSSDLNIHKNNYNKINSSYVLKTPVIGHVIKRGYIDEISEEKYIIIKTKDEKHFFIELEKYSEKIPAKCGELVRIESTKAFSGPKISDKTIDQEARANGGVYDAGEHSKIATVSGKLPPNVTAKEYVQVHINRLEVLVRRGWVEKLSESRFLVPQDYLENLSNEAKKSQEGFKPHIKVTRLAPAKIQKPSISRGLKPC